MSRLTAVPLFLVAILGAGATAYLAMSLAAGDAPVRGSAEGGRGQPGESPGQGTTEIRASLPSDLGAAPVGPRGGALQDTRDAHDSAEFRAEMAEAARRVAEIVETFAAEENGSRRKILGAELQALLKHLGGRIDAPTKERLFDLFVGIDGRWKPLVGQAIGALEGDVDSAERLVRMSAEPGADVRTLGAIYGALGTMRVHEVVPDLAAMLGEGARNEAMIVRAIGAIGGEGARNALLDCLAQPIRPEARYSIEAVLGSSNDEQVADAAAAALITADAPARRSLVAVLGMSPAMGTRHADSLRRLAVDDPDEDVRLRAIRALGRVGDPESGEALLRIIADGGPLASHAVNAIHEIPNPETVSALASRWDRLGEGSRTALMNTAQRIPNPTPDLVARARTSLYDRDERVRSDAAKLLGRPGRDEAVEPLVEFLRRARSNRERNAAIEALMKINTRAAAEAVTGHVDLLPATSRDGYRERCRGILERQQG